MSEQPTESVNRVAISRQPSRSSESVQASHGRTDGLTKNNSTTSEGESCASPAGGHSDSAVSEAGRTRPGPRIVGEAYDQHVFGVAGSPATEPEPRGDRLYQFDTLTDGARLGWYRPNIWVEAFHSNRHWHADEVTGWRELRPDVSPAAHPSTAEPVVDGSAEMARLRSSVEFSSQRFLATVAERDAMRIELPAMRRIAVLAGNVMATLATHGPGIVGHLLDTDDNDGQRLREALAAVSR